MTAKHELFHHIWSLNISAGSWSFFCASTSCPPSQAEGSRDSWGVNTVLHWRYGYLSNMYGHLENSNPVHMNVFTCTILQWSPNRLIVFWCQGVFFVFHIITEPCLVALCCLCQCALGLDLWKQWKLCGWLFINSYWHYSVILKTSLESNKAFTRLL